MTKPQCLPLDTERPGEGCHELILQPGRLLEKTLCWTLMLGAVASRNAQLGVGKSTLTNIGTLNLATHGS